MPRIGKTGNRVRIGSCELIRGDCYEYLRELEDRCSTLITDPPYGISHKCNFSTRGRDVLARCNDYEDVEGDSTPFDPSPLLGFQRKILWGANHFADKLPASGGWLVWDKKRPPDLDQSTCELAWTDCVKGVRIFRHLYHGMMRESEHGEQYHPTQKPVALFSWILRLRWLRGRVDSVADPFMGSGPLAVACQRLGVNYVGVEINPTYFQTACERVRAEYEVSNWLQ